MKFTNLVLAKKLVSDQGVSAPVLSKNQYWLLGMTTALLAVYITLVWQSGDTAHLGMSVLFYLATGSLLWEKRHHLRCGGSLFPKIVAILLIGFVLWQGSVLLHKPDLTEPVFYSTVRIFPFVSAIALALLASGFKQLKQYGQELSILFFLGVPSLLAQFLPDLSPITAQFSTLLLWYTGFNVSLEDVYISLPTGTIKVYAGCSGIESMTYLLGLSVIGLVMFPVARIKQIFVPILAIAIGFFVNGVRVALMAILSAAQNKTAFDYWHEGDGSLIFGMIAVFVFGFCYWWLYRQNQVNVYKR